MDPPWLGLHVQLFDVNTVDIVGSGAVVIAVVIVMWMSYRVLPFVVALVESVPSSRALPFERLIGLL